MSNQLGLDLAATIVHCYECCVLPCGPLSAPPDAVYPHAADCTNPNVGEWIHRETGWTMRRLHCGDDVMAGRKLCPHGGRFARSGVFDPYDGACCLTLASHGVAPPPSTSERDA